MPFLNIFSKKNIELKRFQEGSESLRHVMSEVWGTNVGIIPFLSLFCSLIHALTKPTKLKRSRAEKTRIFDTKTQRGSAKWNHVRIFWFYFILWFLMLLKVGVRGFFFHELNTMSSKFWFGTFFSPVKNQIFQPNVIKCNGGATYSCSM